METPVRDPEPVEVPSATDVAELHLLISEMDDELTGYRRREAVWVSIVVHVLAFLALIFIPKWMPKSAVAVPITPTDRDLTFVVAPPDRQRVKPPNTDIASDKNRIAQSHNPVLNKDALRKILDANRPGPPKPVTPPPAPNQQQAMQAPAPPQPSQQQQAGAQNAPQPPQTQQTAQLHTPPVGGNPFKTTGPGIQHAIDSLGASHGPTHYSFSVGGDYGTNRAQPNTTMRGDVEITSDTMGVDFGPYLQRVLTDIRTHWYELVPEAARPPLMKNGSLIIAFAILKEGNVSGMTMERSSSDQSLDRAAWGGITHSNPFEPLPREFPGNYLGLRIKFIYNPTANDLR